MVLKSFDQGFALFILVEAPPFAKLETKNPATPTSPQDWRYPEFSTSLLARAHTKPNHYQDWRGATPGCSFCEATSLLVLVPPHHAALPGRHAPSTRQVGLIASPPSCFEWCFSPFLFRCRDSKPWTGGGDLQAHHGWTGLAHPQAGGHQDAP